MSKIWDYLMRVGEDAYESKKGTIQALYNLSGNGDNNVPTTRTITVPALHHCEICNADHY